jgi:excisionase family DNA binding protein
MAMKDTFRLAYNIGEAAQLIGVSKSTMWRAVKSGGIRTTRLGDRVLVSHKELERLLKKSEVAITLEGAAKSA